MLGANRTASAPAIASSDSRRGDGELGAFVLDRVDVVLVAATDEPLLEGESPGRRDDMGAQPIVGRGEEAGSELDACAERGRDLGERRTVAQGSSAHEVETDVAVAEPEPVLASPRRGRLERVPRLVGAAPTALSVDQPGERVEQAVEVGRDVEPEDLDVVADVSDDGELVRRRARRRDRARSGRRRPRPRGGRPSPATARWPVKVEGCGEPGGSPHAQEEGGFAGETWFP